jgi:hypothetical protein
MQSFPLLALSVVLYAGVNIVMGGDPAQPWYDGEAFTVALMSGDVWHVSVGDVFLIASMVLLFIEVVRSTRSGGESLINHAFSVLVFVAALMLFLTRPGYGNSTFFILVAMTLLDFLAGFIITAVAARRDVSYGRVGPQ